MKPVKKNNQGATKKVQNDNKKISQGETKKALNENQNKIPNYFQNGDKAIVGVPLNEFGNTKPIYVQALKKTLESRDAVVKVNESKVHEAFVTVEAEGDNNLDNLFEVEICDIVKVSPDCAGCLARDKKYKDLMKLYLRSTHRFSELDYKYNDLLRTKTYQNLPEADATISSTNDVFTPHEIKYLQAMTLTKAGDSTFILKCLEFAYKADTSVLRSKTLKGVPESVLLNDDGSIELIAKKDALTPLKVQRIKKLFIDRLSKCDIDSVAFGERIKEANVNRLFATGIINVSKKSK